MKPLLTVLIAWLAATSQAQFLNGRIIAKLDCLSEHACVTHGVCNTFNATAMFCVCDTDWTGAKCETRLIDRCAPSGCGDGGECWVYEAEKRCRCIEGFKGDHCESIDAAFVEVVPAEDEEDIRCESTGTSFNCSRSMDYCAVYSTVCTNGATCANTEAGFQCICPPDQTGPSCEFNIDLERETLAVIDDGRSPSVPRSDNSAILGILGCCIVVVFVVVGVAQSRVRKRRATAPTWFPPPEGNSSNDCSKSDLGYSPARPNPVRIKRGRYEPMVEPLPLADHHTILHEWLSMSVEEATSTDIHSAIAPYLRTRQVDINAQDSYGNTALHLVIGTYRVGLLHYLLAFEEIDPCIENIYEITPLLLAIRNRDQYAVERLLRHYKVRDTLNHCSSRNYSALVSSVHYGTPDITRLLLEAGADPNYRGEDRFGTDLNEERTALHHAAQLGSIKQMEVLIVGRAKIDARDLYRRTALFFAAAGGFKAAVEMLIEQGANKNLSDANGVTPRMIAQRKGFVEVADYLATDSGSDKKKKRRGPKRKPRWSTDTGYQSARSPLAALSEEDDDIEALIGGPTAKRVFTGQAPEQQRFPGLRYNSALNDTPDFNDSTGLNLNSPPEAAGSSRRNFNDDSTGSDHFYHEIYDDQ